MFDERCDRSGRTQPSCWVRETSADNYMDFMIFISLPITSILFDNPFQNRAKFVHRLAKVDAGIEQ